MTFEDFIRVKRLSVRFERGESLELSEKTELFTYLKSLKKDGDYVYDCNKLSELSEAMFHDVFISQNYTKNILGDNETISSSAGRQFPIEFQMEFLNKSLSNWDEMLGDGGDDSEVMIRSRIDRKRYIKSNNQRYNRGQITKRERDYSERFINLASYDVYLLSDEQMKGQGQRQLGQFGENPVYVTRAIIAHILFMHFIKDLEQTLKKSKFDEQINPLRLVDELQGVVQLLGALIPFKKESLVSKIDYEWRGRIYRLWLKSESQKKDGGKYVYFVQTWTPLDVPSAVTFFNEHSETLEKGTLVFRYIVYYSAS